MVRSSHLIGAFFAVIYSQATYAQPIARTAFESFSARNFDELFNREAEKRGLTGRLSKSTCAGNNCSYLFQSVGVLVTPVAGSDHLDGLTWFCVKDCEPADFVIGITLSLRVLAPGLQDQQYGAWLGNVAEALKGGVKSTTQIGPAKLTLGAYGALGVMAFISKQ